MLALSELTFISFISMRAFIHSTALVIGTAIGAGFLALPLSGSHLNVPLIILATIVSIFVTYRSSVMAVDLNEFYQSSASLDKLCRIHVGRWIFVVALASLYLLSLSFLTGYFACFSDMLCAFLPVNRSIGIVASACGLFFILSLRTRFFENLNSLFVFAFLTAILLILLQIGTTCSSGQIETKTNFLEFPCFLPILFASFTMQTVCPYIYNNLEGRRKTIRRALLIGSLIPGIIYALWMICVLKTVAQDPMFWQRLQANNVSVGELIAFLCDTLPYASVGTILKTVTVLGVVTSAIGYGIGLLQSVQNIFPKPLARFLICLVPAAINLLAPNLFIHILTFIGMVSAVFTIFVPYYLTVRHMKQRSLSGLFCFLFGVMIVICEIVYEWA